MTEIQKTGRQSTRLEPETTWTVVADSPLKGLAMAREAGTILAWDEGNQLYLYSVQGEPLSYSRVASRIQAGAISDDGSLIALLVDAEDAGLLLLNADFQVECERPAPSEATFVTIDPHGRYVAVGTRQDTLYLLNRYGRAAGRLETIGSLSHLCFVPDRPLMIGAAAFGMLTGVSLEPNRSQGRLETEVLWQDRLMSNVGRLAVTGDGAMILASCYTLGIQRFDLRGRNEGSYHPGGTVSHAVPDFPGRTIAAATLEGDLAVMNSAGNVRWRTRLPRPVIALEIDPLGRYLIHGHATGEIVRLDLFGGGQGRSSKSAARRPAATSTSNPATGNAARMSSGPVRAPDWLVPAVQTDQQSETAVIAVTEGPALIALFTSPHRLELYGGTGQTWGQGPTMSGVGRILRTAPGWLAAATDRQILLWDLKHNSQKRLDVSLLQLTHLAIKPDDFGLALIQERDRIGRLTPSARWVWKHELREPVEDLAIGPNGYAAVTTHGGELVVFDPAGVRTIGFSFDPADPPLLIEAPERSASSVVWVSVARRSQWLRGHGLLGDVLWESPIVWEPWSVTRLPGLVLLAAADGRALVYDGSGTIRAQGPASGDSKDVFCVDPDGQPVRISRRGVHLISATLDGRVRWRSVVDQPFGPLAAGTPGTAVLLGKSLAWFKNEPDTVEG
jgi:hypothetical protein